MIIYFIIEMKREIIRLIGWRGDKKVNLAEYRGSIEGIDKIEIERLPIPTGASEL